MADTLFNINQAGLIELLKRHLNDDMLKAAEPIIQKALADIEREMRAALVPRLVSLIEHRVDMYQDKQKLIITINQEPRP